jgi:hypothetical protein
LMDTVLKLWFLVRCAKHLQLSDEDIWERIVAILGGEP